MFMNEQKEYLIRENTHCLKQQKGIDYLNPSFLFDALTILLFHQL
jgi:hypothetical protein